MSFRRMYLVYLLDEVSNQYHKEISSAIAYNKAVDLAHQAGISKNFPENYIEELSASSYADIYQQISLSPKYLSYLKGLPRK